MKGVYMESSKYNSITFCRGAYKNDKGELDEYKMYDDITSFIRIAINNNYQMKIIDDSYTIIIEYNYADPELQSASLEWIGENEYVARYGDDYDDE